MEKLKQHLMPLLTILGVLFLTTGQCPAGTDFNRTIEDLAEKLTSSTSGKVIDVDAGTVYLNLGERDSVFSGARFEVVELGEIIMDGSKAYHKEKPVGIIEVTRVRKELSLAKIVHEIKPIGKGNIVYQITSLSPARMASTAPQGNTEVIAVTGIDLESVFRRLEAAGFNPGPYSVDKLNRLSQAIKRFQKMAKVEESGMLDMATWKKMEKLYDPASTSGDLSAQGAEVKPKSSPAPQLVFTGGKKINKIALMEFAHGNSFNELTRNIYESLNVSLIRKGYQVVERSKLDQVLEEQKLGYSGLIDASTAQKLGKLMGGEIVLVGSLADLGNGIAVRARMVDVEKGTAVTAAEVILDKTPDILAAAETGVNGTKTGTRTSRSKKSASRSGKKPVSASMVVHDFTFDLQQCKKSGQSATCTLLITNNAEDRNLRLMSNNGKSSSILFDNNGNRYVFDNIKLANCTDRNWCKMTLIKGIPTKAIFTLGGLAGDAEYAPVFEISGQSSDYFKVQFRDVTFTD